MDIITGALTTVVCLFARYVLHAKPGCFLSLSFERLLRQSASQVFEDFNPTMCVLGLAQSRRARRCLLPLPCLVSRMTEWLLVFVAIYGGL